jgi:hypothetical protein
MNDLNTSDAVKIGFGVALMGVWVGMVVAHVTGADDIVAFCKLGLTGLATHYLTNYGTTPPAGTTTITTTAPGTGGTTQQGVATVVGVVK